jgi:hypothetical protein
MSGMGIAKAADWSGESFERIGDQIVLMIMIKPTKKTKKASVDTGAVAIEPVKPAAALPAAPAVAQPASAKAESRRPARVALQLVEPAAKHVYVAGSFNGWKPETTPLAPLGNGRWKGDLNLGPGRHEYLFVVDGKWLPDPNAKESVQNPFGGRNSVLTVSE